MGTGNSQRSVKRKTRDPWQQYQTKDGNRMKYGRSISELAQEVKRRSESKWDPIVRTRDLRFSMFPIMEEAEAIVERDPLHITTIGPGHDVLTEWWEGLRGGGQAHAMGMAVRKEEFAAILSVPNGKDPVTGQQAYRDLAMNGLMHDQLGGHLDIPAKYYDRLHDNHPALLSENINTLLQASPIDEKRMVRSTLMPGAQGIWVPTARAFLSNTYETLDNWDLMRFLMPLFAPKDTVMNDGTIIPCLKDIYGNPLKVTFPQCDITDTNLHITVEVPQMKIDLRPGTTISAGAYIFNSEVGFAKIGIRPFYKVSQCTNGAYIEKFGNSRRHVGQRKDAISGEGNDASRFFTDATKRAKDKAFFLEMADVLRGTLTEETFRLMLDPIRQSMGIKLEGTPEAAVETAGRMMGWSAEDQDDIMRYLIDGGDLTLWGLSNAATRYAQDQDSYDRAMELEKNGGDIITLAPSEYRVIVTAEKAKRPNRAMALSLIAGGR